MEAADLSGFLSELGRSEHLAGSFCCCHVHSRPAVQPCRGKYKFATLGEVLEHTTAGYCRLFQRRSSAMMLLGAYLVSEAAVSSSEEVFSRGVLFDRLCLPCLGGSDGAIVPVSGWSPEC